MANEKLLLIDDDPILLKLLTKTFKKSGYHVTCALNANEALDSLKQSTPDLIVLDLMLPETDGFTLLEEIKAKPDWSFIPVVILSALTKQEEKLKGLRLGVMDYITKPFDHEELKARIRNILDFYELKAPKTRQKAKTSHQKLVDYMKDHSIQTLIPRVRRDTKLGYEYPEAAEILKPEEPGGEIFILESMAKSSLLKRIFHDAIHICPTCGNHDLNFREVCPHCDYADIELKKLLTHHACGFRDSAVEFQDGDGYRCPQCLDTLYREGDDYETVASSLHICLGCKEAFSEPIVNCRCMNCDEMFDVSAAHVRKVYAYKLLSDGEESFLQGPPQIKNPGIATEIQPQSSYPDLRFVASDVFEKQIEREINFAKQLHTGVSLLRIQLKPLDHSVDTFEKIQYSCDAVTPIFESILRAQDIVSSDTPNKWIILLAETPYRMAKILADRLYAELERLYADAEIELKITSYPEDGALARELLDILNNGVFDLQVV